MNNLRISHESLDMDDIISDLNPVSQASTSKPVASQVNNQVAQSQLAESDIPSFRSEKPQTTVSKNVKSPPKNLNVNKKPNHSEVKSSGYGQARPISAVNKNLQQVKTNENKNTKNMQSLEAARSIQKRDPSNQGTKIQNIESLQKDLQSMTRSTQGATSQVITNQNDGKSQNDIQGSVVSTKRQAPTQESDSPFYVLKSSNKQAELEEAKKAVSVDVNFTANQDMEETLDSANFTNKLDQLILGFRTETMQEFIKTKGRLNSQKEQAIDAERRRCNTLLNAKQNEIEALKEQLAEKTKMSDEYSLRCEIMALWSGKGQTLARMKVSQMKCFKALKHYYQFNKYSKQVLLNKSRTNRVDQKRKVYQAWVRNFKESKVRRDKEKFDKSVKAELQAISGTYQKEIEMLRQKLDEATHYQKIQERNKHMMQENLKKVFMRSVCALNFEAMSILDPAEQTAANANMMKQLEAQVESAMFMGQVPVQPPQQQPPMENNFMNKQNQYLLPQEQKMQESKMNMTYNPIHQVLNDINQMQNPAPARSEVSFTLSEAGDRDQILTDRQIEQQNLLREQQQLMNMGLMREQQQQQITPSQHLDANSRKIESKDSAWKPAPIIGGQQRSYQQESHDNHAQSITQKLHSLRQNQEEPNYVLPAQFQDNNRFEEIMNQIKEREAQAAQVNQLSSQGVPDFSKEQQNQPKNPFSDNSPSPQEAINNASSLPQFQNVTQPSLPSNLNMMGGLPQINNTEASASQGKAIYAGAQNPGAAIKMMQMNTTQSKRFTK